MDQGQTAAVSEAADTPQQQGQTESTPEEVSTDTKSQPLAATPAESKRHKLNVYGSEVELTEADLIREAQKGLAADKKWQEAAEMMKKAKPVLDKMQAGDLSFVLDNMPKDQFRRFAEDFLLEQLEWDSLTPEQKEHRELKRFKEETEKQKATEKQRLEQEAKAKATAEWAQKLDDEIAEAITSSGRKVTPRTVKRMAENMLALLEQQPSDEFQPVSAKDAFGNVIKELESDVTEYLSSLSAEQLQSVLPKQVLDGLRRLEVDKAMKQNPTYQKRQVSDDAPAPKKQTKITSTDDYINNLIKKFGG